VAGETILKSISPSVSIDEHGESNAGGLAIVDKGGYLGCERLKDVIPEVGTREGVDP